MGAGGSVGYESGGHFDGVHSGNCVIVTEDNEGKVVRKNMQIIVHPTESVSRLTSMITSPSHRSEAIGLRETNSPTSKMTPSQVNLKQLSSQPGYPFLLFSVKFDNWDSPLATLLMADLYLKISKETLDFIDVGTSLPLLQFPYQDILRWAYNSYEKIFQFEVFDLKLYSAEKITQGVKVVLTTSDGAKIDSCIREGVARLMDDIAFNALTTDKFNNLSKALFDDNKLLRDDWKEIFRSEMSLIYLTAKQGIKLLQHVSKYAPFEKTEFVCAIYEKMLYKESFQTIISALDDLPDRDNVVHIIHKKFGEEQKYSSRCALGSPNYEVS